MSCNSLHAWFITQSQFIAMVFSLIADGGSDLRLYAGSGVKFLINGLVAAAYL